MVQAYLKRAPAVIDWIAGAGARHRPAHDRAAGEGRLLGRRDQARAGRRPRRLPGVHAQGAHATSPTSPAPRSCSPSRDRLYPAVRHAQRARRWPRCSSSRATARLRVPVPARHGRGALRPRRRRGRPGPALPHLRAGRHARDAARLPRAAPARERRQHLVRQPDRRPRIDARAHCVEDPVSRARSLRRQRRIRACPLPAALYPDRRNSRGIDLADEHALARARGGARREAARSRSSPPRARRAARAATPRCARAVRSPADRRVVVGDVAEATRHDVEAALDVRVDARRWPGRRGPAAERARVLEQRRRPARGARAARFIHLAVREAGKTIAQRRRRSARGRRLLPLLRAADPRGGAAGRAAGPRRLHQPVELSARDLRRPGGAARSPRATRWSRSPPSRRRSSPPRRCALLHEAGVPRGRAAAAARRGRDRRRARSSPIRASRRRVHRLDRRRRAHPPHARRARQRAARSPRPAGRTR